MGLVFLLSEILISDFRAPALVFSKSLHVHLSALLGFAGPVLKDNFAILSFRIKCERRLLVKAS